MISPTPLRCYSTSEPPFSLAAELFTMPEPQPFLQCGAASWSSGNQIWCRAQAGTRIRTGARNQASWQAVSACPLCPFVPLSKHVNTRSSWAGVQASHIPSVSFTGPPNSLGDYPSQYQTPGQGHRVCAFTCLLPGEDLCLCNLYSPLSLFPGMQVPTWLLVYPSYLIPYGSIGVSLLVSS